MKRKTLLELALEVKRKRISNQSSDEEVELVFAWLRGEVGATQICVTLKKKMATGNYLYWAAVTLRNAYHSGRLKIV